MQELNPLDQGFPIWGTCAFSLGVAYICLSQEKDSLHSRSKLTLRHKNVVYLYNSKNLKIIIKMQWIFVILLRNLP